MVKTKNTQSTDLEIDKTNLEPEIKVVKLQKKFTRGKHPMPAVLRIPGAILFLMIMAIFLTWFMIWRTNMCDADAAMSFIQEKPTLALYDYAVIFSLMALLAAVTWRPFLSTGATFCALGIISFIHMQKFRLRAEPLLPEEFALIDSTGDLIQFVDVNDIIRLIAGVVFVLVGSILAEYYVRKFVGRNPKKLAWWDRMALIPRCTFTAIALVLVTMTFNPILQRKRYEWIEDAELVAWNQVENYEKNGFILGFIYNLGKATIPEPDNYSEETMRAIAEEYEAIKAADDAERMDWSEVDNVIVVLAETFYDPALYAEYYSHTGGDVTPNLHQIFRDYPSGFMYSPEYGGGTANVEFEVQTGLTNYWAQSFPYVNIIPKLNQLYGIAQLGKGYDFSTTAIHSYTGSVYKRNLAYPRMGYDTFIDAEGMNHTEHEYSSTVINDDSIYKEVLDLIENNDAKQVIGVVTMQNHAPYEQAHYPEHEFRQKEEHPENWALEANYQSLHEADAYLGDFIKALDKIDEKTVVLWFGDHAMGMLDQYNKSGGKEGYDLSHLTPYFVYTNFEVENKAEIENNAKKLGFDLGAVAGVDLPITSPNCLQNTMLNVTNLQKPAFFYLLDDVCTNNPILTHAYLNGTQPKYNDALRKYELVNYDMLLGKQYWDGM